MLLLKQCHLVIRGRQCLREQREILNVLVHLVLVEEVDLVLLVKQLRGRLLRPEYRTVLVLRLFVQLVVLVRVLQTIGCGQRVQARDPCIPMEIIDRNLGRHPLDYYPVRCPDRLWGLILRKGRRVHCGLLSSCEDLYIRDWAGFGRAEAHVLVAGFHSARACRVNAYNGTPQPQPAELPPEPLANQF